MLALVPWPYRVLAVALLAVALFGFGWLKGHQAGERELLAYQASEQRESLKLLQDTILRSKALQSKKDEALHAAEKREEKLRADVRATDDAAAGLRVDLRESRELLSRASASSLRARLSAVEDVLGDCVDRYRRVAAEADRLSSERRALIESWPQDGH